MKLQYKALPTKSIQVDEEGSFKAVFSMFNVKDLDGDWTEPTAFTKDQEVRISHWGHRWQDLPVGKGSIDFDGKEAWVNGKFFLDTAGGQETYKTVKNLGSLQEWSYGFKVLNQGPGTKNGEEVNILKKLDVFEVSPVLLGAGIGTRTDAIKSAEQTLCLAVGCKEESSTLICLCEKHWSTDVVAVATTLKQALKEEAIEALIAELTPPPPAPKGAQMHQMLAMLSEARANSHSMGGLRS